LPDFHGLGKQRIEARIAQADAEAGHVQVGAAKSERACRFHLAQGSDLFLCEATFGPGEEYTPDLHLTARQAGEHATKAGVDRLVVTHVPPWVSREVQREEAAAAFDGRVEVATAGAQFEI